MNLGLNSLICLKLLFSQAAPQRAALSEASELLAELVDSLVVIGDEFVLIDVWIVEVVDIVGVQTVDASEQGKFSFIYPEQRVILLDFENSETTGRILLP